MASHAFVIPCLSRAALAIALALVANSAAAVAGHAVVSLVGREFTLVQYRPAIGSNASRDTSDRFAVGSAALDDAAVLAADDVIRKVRPDVRVKLLRAGDAVAQMQEAWAASGKVDVAGLLDRLGAAVDRGPGDRLILIASETRPIRMKIEYGDLRSTRAAGLGFFLDRDRVLARDAQYQTGVGVLGVFANFRILVIDTARAVIVAEEGVSAGTAVSAGRASDGDPWNALSSEAKVSMLRELLVREIGTLLPDLLRKPGA
jgi:hypothetical protein